MVARLYGRKKAKITAEMALEVLGQTLQSPPLDAQFTFAVGELRARG